MTCINLMLLILLLLFIVYIQSISVTVHYYDDADCTNLRNTLTYDMETCQNDGNCTQDCYEWSRSHAGSTHTNGANNFRCFKGWGILYHQWIENEAICGSEAQAKIKESRIGCCIAEPSGNLYSRIEPEHASDIDNCATEIPSYLPQLGDCSPAEETHSDGSHSHDDGHDHDGAKTGGKGKKLGDNVKYLLFGSAGCLLIACILKVISPKKTKHAANLQAVEVDYVSPQQVSN